MSRLYVRDSLRAEIEDYLLTLAEPVPFYDTIGQAELINDVVWVTAEFTAYETEDVCYGGTKRIERGSCDVVVFIDAGEGDAEAVALADKLADHFNGFISGTLSVVNVSPPNEFYNGDARRWYGVSISLEYFYGFN